MKLPNPLRHYKERRHEDRVLEALKADLYSDLDTGPEDVGDSEYSAVRTKAGLQQLVRNTIGAPAVERRDSASWLRQNKFTVLFAVGTLTVFGAVAGAEILLDQHAESRIQADKDRGDVSPGSPAYQAAMQQAMQDGQTLRTLRVCSAELDAEAAWQYSLMSQPPANDPLYQPEIAKNPAFLTMAANSAAKAGVPCTGSNVYTVPETYQKTVNDIQLTLMSKSFSTFSVDTVCRDRDQLRQALEIAPQAHDYEIESRRYDYLGTFMRQVGVQCPLPPVSE